jgi:hypothetical protein
MQRLVESASGLRHLRWAREILGALEVHYEHDARLAQDQRDAVLSETVELRATITDLSQHVKAYRDFMERERTRFRGMLRVGAYLTATAHDAEQRADASAVQAGFEEAFASMERREQAPRKQELREAIGRLREALVEMDARLANSLSDAFVESLYPPLVPLRTHVADLADDDDDATAGWGLEACLAC